MKNGGTISLRWENIVLHGQTLFRTEGKVWDMAIEQLVTRNLISQHISSHDVVMAIAEVRLATFLHP